MEACNILSELITSAIHFWIRVSGSFIFSSPRIPTRSAETQAETDPSVPNHFFAVRLSPSLLNSPHSLTRSFDCSIYPPSAPAEKIENPALIPIRRRTEATFSRNDGSRSNTPLSSRVFAKFSIFSGLFNAFWRIWVCHSRTARSPVRASLSWRRIEESVATTSTSWMRAIWNLVILDCILWSKSNRLEGAVASALISALLISSPSFSPVTLW